MKRHSLFEVFVFQKRVAHFMKIFASYFDRSLLEPYQIFDQLFKNFPC
jgi:hypothetical protein